MVLFRDENKWNDIKTKVLEYIYENKEFFTGEYPREYIEERRTYHSEVNQLADNFIILVTAHCYSIKIIIESDTYGKIL